MDVFIERRIYRIRWYGLKVEKILEMIFYLKKR